MKLIIAAILLLSVVSLAEPVACELVEFKYDSTSSEGCRCAAWTVIPQEEADTSHYYHEYKVKSCNRGKSLHEESYSIEHKGNFMKDSITGDVIDRLYVPDLNQYTTRTQSVYVCCIEYEKPRSKQEMYRWFGIEYGKEDAKYLLWKQ